MSDVFVAVTPWESRICTWTGKQRFLNAQELDRDPGEGPSASCGDAQFHIRGAHCEFAASLMLNLYWRPNVGEIKKPDVGGLVEVRSTVLEAGRLIVKAKDVLKSADTPFVLIVADMDALKFRFGGWIFARDATAWPPNGKHGDPAHYVEQKFLLSYDSLRAWLRFQDG
jgi:hypothetical protein